MPPAVLLRRLLLLPLLAPLLAVLLVGTINPRPWVGLRLLIWRSPEWSIGSWIALAAGGGAALSASATALALQAGGAGNRHQLRRPFPEGRSRRVWPWGRDENPADGPTEAWGERSSQGPAPGRGRDSRDGPAAPWPGQASAGPSRHPAEPQPTLSVPFRVIRRGKGSAGPQPNPQPDPQPDPQAAPQASRRPSLWPLGNRQQTRPAQGAGGPSPADPATVDRSWQLGADADW